MIARKIILTLALFSVFALAACDSTNDATPDVEYFSQPEFAEMDLPFAAAVRAGDLIFLSGQIGNIPGKFEIVMGGIEAETRQTMDNISSVLQHIGSSFDDVVKCTVYIVDMSEWPAMNAVYRTYFTNPPARSASGSDALALGAKVEIECIAVAR
jgi:reactive intermediate/imine deaminase